MTISPEMDLSLSDSLQQFADALSRSDVQAARQFLDQEVFTLTSLDAELRTHDLPWWLTMVPNFVLLGATVHHEVVHQHGDQALHERHLDMTSRVGDVERSGSFVLSDSWRRRADGRWALWHRSSLPVGNGPTLPASFTSDTSA